MSDLKKYVMLFTIMGENKKILIIEDEAMLSDLYKRTLEKESFEVREVSDPTNVIQLIHTFAPNLILLDIMLPGMSGIDLLKLIKSDPETNAIPIFMTTNVAEEESLQHAIELGAEEYLNKSEYTPQGIAEHIKQYFRDHSD